MCAATKRRPSRCSTSFFKPNAANPTKKIPPVGVSWRKPPPWNVLRGLTEGDVGEGVDHLRDVGRVLEVGFAPINACCPGFSKAGQESASVSAPVAVTSGHANTHNSPEVDSRFPPAAYDSNIGLLGRNKVRSLGVGKERTMPSRPPSTSGGAEAAQVGRGRFRAHRVPGRTVLGWHLSCSEEDGGRMRKGEIALECAAESECRADAD